MILGSLRAAITGIKDYRYYHKQSIVIISIISIIIVCGFYINIDNLSITCLHSKLARLPNRKHYTSSFVFYFFQDLKVTQEHSVTLDHREGMDRKGTWVRALCLLQSVTVAVSVL